ncbi:hypothetical protein [Tolumonas lignilytica]|uniref:hypothetical protein n=1 Tax=Tolumonas lignilytica TaxID=1283284 RepID=UPI00046656DA|nr:hypothetical protein [Tolumonas lignilytica]
MVFIATPDVMPQAVPQESIVLAAASDSASSASSIRSMTYGVCELSIATEDDISEEDDSSVNSLHPTTYMNNFLPAEMKILLESRGSGGIDWEWYGEWLESFKVSILQQPAHGKFVNLRNDPKFHDLQYLPNRDYLGKDRVAVLVEGKDERGRSIALTLKYFINVLPRQKLHQIVEEGQSAKLQEKLCGKSESYWHDHDSWKISENQTFKGLGQANTMVQFADFSGYSLGDTTGTDSSAQITLDINAAGYGWYIDYTPYLNSEYLQPVL